MKIIISWSRRCPALYQSFSCPAVSREWGLAHIYFRYLDNMHTVPVTPHFSAFLQQIKLWLFLQSWSSNTMTVTKMWALTAVIKNHKFIYSLLKLLSEIIQYCATAPGNWKETRCLFETWAMKELPCSLTRRALCKALFYWSPSGEHWKVGWMLKLLVEVSVPSVTISAATMAKTVLASYSSNGTCSPTAWKNWSDHMV